ncbi:MAG: YARHG domain-containing protein [Ectothiorhodospiraceae bacterium]|nr:YARHG domain-containing protein [Ectothiorhodospiraceae bacterium]
MEPEKESWAKTIIKCVISPFLVIVLGYYSTQGVDKLSFSFNINSNQESDRYPYWMVSRLSRTELSQKSKRELDLIRNEIFARHGYIFQMSKYRDYFNGQPWYSPRYTCREFKDKSPLTDVQNYNVALIRRYQQEMGHFDDYDEIPCE